MPDTQVLITGAGPSGLILALWLTKLGVRVRIIDQNTGPGTTSRAVAVQARTLELYRQIGLAEALVDGGVVVPAINFWVRGHRQARIAFRDAGQGLTPFPLFLTYPQDVHEHLLVAQLEALGIMVERRTALVRFEQHADGIRAELRMPDGSIGYANAAYLAGCDGAHSAVRENLGIGFPGGTYAEVFYVADVEARGLVTNQEIHADLDTADIALVFPLKGEGRLRLIGTIRDSAVSNGTSATFDDVRGSAIKQLQVDVTKVNWFSTYRVHHRVANSFGKDRVFLIGDAAHIHSPVGGQGMNTGIGDAINLSWKLAAVLDKGAPATLLDTYQTERIHFARRLVATTDRLFTLATKRGTAAQLVRTRLAPLIVPLLFSMRFFRRFMFRTVSQIDITYRYCGLNAGVAGRIHGGDRLPWISLGDNASNFDSLTTLDWQVHVYGEARSILSAECTKLALPLHTFPWRQEMHAAGLARNAVYLVRPDGYIGLADANGDPQVLATYMSAVRHKQ